MAAGLALLPVDVAHAAPPPPLSVGTERALSAARPGNVQTNAATAFVNGVFFVVWEESPIAGGTTQIYGARVKPDGTVLDPAGIVLSSRPLDNNIRPRVAGGAGKFLVVWQIDIEGTYSDLGAALVTTAGRVQRQWGLSFGDNGQFAPDVAWNGQLFMAAWQDEPDPEDEDIYGARITSNGLTLDGCSSDSCPSSDDVGIPIALGLGNQIAPRITATAALFQVAYTDQTDPARPEARTAAVALNGFPLDQSGTDLTQGPGAQTYPAAASNGGTALFAWTDTGAGPSDIHATTMKPGSAENYSPQVGQPNGIVVSAAAGAQTAPAIARRSGHFVVAWTDARSGNADIYAARVGVGGAVFDGTGVAVATGGRQQRAASLASSGPKVLVAYQHDVPSGGDRVFLRIVS
jgi:hypothetical protein